MNDQSDLEGERLDLTEQLNAVRSEIAAVNGELRQLRMVNPKGFRTAVTDAEQRRQALVTKQSDLEVDLARVKREIQDRHQPLPFDDPRVEMLRLMRKMADGYELVPLHIVKELRELVNDVDDVSAGLRTWAEL